MKKVIFISAISGGILFWSIYLQADNFDCRNAETQTEINQCAYQDFQQKNEELSQIYQQYYAKLETKRQQQLQYAQSVWMTFRDLSCQYEADYYQGGSLAPMVYSSCLKDKTIERINDLKNYIALY
ncbi:lysozyme inhibitor LprI family protein [Proteus mirabilis]|nr:lysozyme inhibitor LprI family protein [Proteus mirabilis]WFC30378.1 lysozyme inhibitor LprI family protein [Proteus mirabilis]